MIPEQYSVYTQPGYIFPREQRTFCYPLHNINEKRNESLPYHYASKTEQVYSPFQSQVYYPPHLNSSKVRGLMNKGQCQGWKIKHQKGKNKTHLGERNNNKNYDEQYWEYERRVRETNKLYKENKYGYIGSKIKYLVDEDKPMMATAIDYNYYDGSGSEKDVNVYVEELEE